MSAIQSTDHTRHERRAALFILVLGTVACWGSLHYPVGTLARMGPGYFPLLLGAGLILTGSLMLLATLHGPSAADGASPAVSAQAQPSLRGVRLLAAQRARIRALACIIAGIVAFVLLARQAGFIYATFALTGLSALGDRNNSVREALILAIVITASATGLFYFVLGIQLPLFA